MSRSIQPYPARLAPNELASVKEYVAASLPMWCQYKPGDSGGDQIWMSCFSQAETECY